MTSSRPDPSAAPSRKASAPNAPAPRPHAPAKAPSPRQVEAPREVVLWGRCGLVPASKAREPASA